MNTPAPFVRTLLQSAYATFLDLDLLERLAMQHNHQLMVACPNTQAWLRGKSPEPKNPRMVSLRYATAARKLAGGGRLGVKAAEAREEDLIEALPAALKARTHLLAELEKVGVWH